MASSDSRLSTVSFLGRHLRRYTGWAAVALVAILGYALSSAALVALIEPIFAEVLVTSPAAASAVAPIPVPVAEEAPERFAGFTKKLNLKRRFDNGYRSLKRILGINPDNALYLVPLLALAVYLLRSLADFGSGYAFQRIGLGVTTDIRNELFRSIVDQSSRFHREHSSGELLSRVVNDVSVVQTAVSTRVLDLFQQSATLVFLLLLLVSTNLKLSLVCLVVAPVFVYPIVRFGHGMRTTSRSSQERMAELSQLLAQAVRGHRVVKAFGMEDFEYARFAAATRRHLKVKLRSQVFANISGPVVGALAAVGGSVFLIYAGRAIRSGELTGPLVVQFLANLMLLYDPVRRLNRVNLVLQDALAAVHRVRDLVAVPIDVSDQPGAMSVSTFTSEIVFEGVTFSYGEQEVLRGVDLEIKRGETVALVGPSGGGKTTVVNLLLRFFDPDEGRVMIDGVELRDLTRASLVSLIGIVSQDTVLFDDTVRNNIAYGRSNVSMETVREAAAAAFADDFVMELVDGYETRLGEDGARLSGGQRQRIAIARALLKNVPILILDEATSQLDVESEELVKRALTNLMSGRTTLVIAHRLSTIVSADRIAVMEDGIVTEIGSHRELVERNGTYRRLHDLQFNG